MEPTDGEAISLAEPRRPSSPPSTSAAASTPGGLVDSTGEAGGLKRG